MRWLSGSGTGPSSAASCRRGGQVGIFTETGGVWRRIGPTLGGRLSGSATRVLRLDVAGSMTTALVAASSSRRYQPGRAVATGRRIMDGVDSTPGRRRTRRFLSTGVGADGEQLVLVGSPGRTPTLAEISPGGSWTRLPAPPPGAVTLAPMSDGSVDAFGVTGSALRVYTLSQGSNTWVRSQSMEVPIAYGSSS